MFTTCPKCSLKLVVTAADLRVAQGFVRCGRCSNVFNALAGLSDEQQAVLAREQTAPVRRPALAPTPPSSASIPAPHPDEPVPDTALEFDASSTDVSDVFVEPAGDDDPTGTFESIVLRSEDAPESEVTAPQEDRDTARENSETHELEVDLEALVSRRDASATAAPPRPSPPSHATERSHAPPPAHAAADEPPPPAFGESRRPARADRGLDERSAGAHRTVDRVLRIGSTVLALMLVLQIIHHERAELAGFAWLRGPLTAAYSALGLPLAPHWDVRAYEVRQLGAVVGPRTPGALTVRASVKNNAPREQPLPLLRVTMQDRFGNRVAARDVPPSAYLPAGSANRTDLAAGQRVDAEIAFVDPGPNAVGFEIDACLKLASGRIACANDAGAQR